MQRPSGVNNGDTAMSNQTIARIATAVLVMTATACTASNSLTTPSVPRHFQGDWEGAFKVFMVRVPDAPEVVESDKSVRLRIVVSNSDARIYVSGRDLDAHRSETIWLDTNAVITGFRTGFDNDGVWVETWSVAVTVIDSEHLLATYQRQVRNKDLPRDHRSFVFAHVGYSVLERN
jgi:hypothetical protein